MQDFPETRVSLILRIRESDDVQAWQEFAEIYQPLVYRLARRKGWQHADALELTQEVLAAVAEAVQRWDPDPDQGSFRGWIYRIARNLMINALTRRNRQPQATGNTEIQQLIQQQPDPASQPTATFDLEYRRQVFAWAAKRVRSHFSHTSWEAFWQTAIQDRPIRQVADQLGISAGAVYIARSRVMDRLKAEVQRQVHDEVEE